MIYCLGILAIVLILFLVLQHKKSRTISVSVYSSPYSVDPYDYDAFIHHATFRSVLATLVNTYKRGGVQPYLAESWESADNFKIWKFKIREGISFQDGTPLTLTTIKNSFTRIAYLSKKNNSQLSFIHKILGADQIKTPTDDLAGIILSDKTIVFKLSESYPGLLDDIAFGLYAVVSDSDWDHATGKWYNVRSINSLGVYYINKWSNDELLLSLNPKSKIEFMHPNASKNVRIVFNSRLPKADIIVGASSQKFTNYSFFGPVPSSIAYVHCLDWNKKGSKFDSLDKRINVREQFYNILKQNGLGVTRSFFPLAMKGIHEIAFNSRDLVNIDWSKISIRELHFPVDYIEKPNTAFAKIAKLVPLTHKELMHYLNPNLDAYPVDLAVTATSVLVDDPIADIKFMFESKEGINLPDATGEIRKKLQATFDPQDINELLVNQGVIWPLGHFAMGIWVQNEFDMSMYNQLLPPIDYSWIGIK